MTIYYAEVDEHFTYQPFGRNDGQWHERRHTMLIEATDIHDAWKVAEKTAEANANFGARLLGMEVRKVHRVELPASIGFECHQQRSDS